MNILKSYKYIIPLLAVMVILGSCNVNDPEDNVFDDTPRVEFKPTSNQVQEPEDDPNTPAVNEGAPITISINVQLIGPQRESDLSVPFTINSDGTSAVEGTHFNIVTSSPVVIPANSSSTTVQVEVLEADGALNAGQAGVLALELQEAAEDVIPAVNLKDYTLTIIGTDPPAAP